MSSAQRSDSFPHDNNLQNSTDASPSSADTSDTVSSRYMIPYRPQNGIDSSSTRYMLLDTYNIHDTSSFDQGPPVIAN